MPMAHMNSGDSNTPLLPLSNRQWAFMLFISQYPKRVWLSERGCIGHSLCLDLWLYIGSTVLLKTVVFVHMAITLVIARSSLSNAILIVLVL